MPRLITPLAVPATPSVGELETLSGVLDSDDCIMPVADGPEGDRARDAARLTDPLAPAHADAVLAVATTGSTGAPKVVLHSQRSLRASIDATAERLGGHGQWLLCLGISHIAGIQVVLRSAAAGTTPVMSVTGGDGFESSFAAAAAQLDHQRRFVSLVPTQLWRLLDSVALPALQGFDAILLGGAAADPALLARAAEAGVRVVTTYGMSETGGGCVYDGVPLAGVDISFTPSGAVRLSGPVVALGYRDRLDPDPFSGSTSGRSFTTSDLGELQDGRLRILGRADDVINSGGKKVAPTRVEEALRALPSVDDAIVVGVPDAQWGERVVALVVAATGSSVTTESVRVELRDSLATHELPRACHVVESLPYKGIGKPDRAAALSLARRL